MGAAQLWCGAERAVQVNGGNGRWWEGGQQEQEGGGRADSRRRGSMSWWESTQGRARGHVAVAWGREREGSVDRGAERAGGKERQRSRQVMHYSNTSLLACCAGGARRAWGQRSCGVGQRG